MEMTLVETQIREAVVEWVAKHHGKKVVWLDFPLADDCTVNAAVITSDAEGQADGSVD